MKILICPDVHCRDFWKPILNVKNQPIIFLGDFLDPYKWEGFTNEHGIENLREIFQFARENDNVTILVGNHDISHILDYYGCERTPYKYYEQTHKLYKDNLDLLKPCLLIEDTLFTHAGVSDGWIQEINQLTGKELNAENIVSYIEEEWNKELAIPDSERRGFWGLILESPIFNIGHCRGGSDHNGGPFWNDYRYEYNKPDWNLFQVVGHCQQEITGSLGGDNGLICCDSRAIFEYDTETKKIIEKNIL